MAKQYVSKSPPKKPLEEQVAEHREKKLRDKVLREEMRKLALAKRKEKSRSRKAAWTRKKREKLIPQLSEEAVASAAPVDPAIKELAKRELLRRRLIEFVKDFHPRYKAGWVHHDICKRLEQFSLDVAAGKSPRLMILMPPRHGKSQLASKLYPAWHLGHHPEHEFIGCSYNISLALDFSREIREVIRTDRYAKIFEKTKLNPDFQSAESWRLISPTGIGAGGYNAAGVGGGITGKGAHILVIDDPVKNAEEAESADMRQKIWNWYQSTAYTRLAPGGGVLVIQTWWHDDDLAGRIQQEMKEDPEADQFVIVKYPAIADEDEEFRMEGEPLHPERYDLEQLLKIKRTLGNRYWAALYQQSPISDEGAFFSEDMFTYRDSSALSVPELHIYQAWDFAISEKQHNDWTVGTTMGMDYEGRVHWLETVRMKTNDSALICDAIIDMYARYPGVMGFGVEDGQIWRAMKSALVKRMKERGIFIPLDDKENILKPITDKQVRARPLQARLQYKQITFPRGQEWVDTVKREFLRFPAGKNDDIVDSAAWCVRLLNGKSPPRRPVYKGRKAEKTVAQKIRDVATGAGAGTHMSA